MPTLAPRLQSVADLVPQGARLADIGTDHAHLPLWLLHHGRLDCAIAADLRSGPLDRARQNAATYGLSERIDLRLCDGLSGVHPDEADTLTIAGMGGETIAGILACAPWSRNCLCILQPMSSLPDLRRWLDQNGYRIEREELRCEGKILYITMVVRGGTMASLTPAEIWAGRQTQDMDSPLRGIYLDRLIHRIQRALLGLRDMTTTRDEARRAELTNVLAGLEQMKEEWDAWQR